MGWVWRHPTLPDLPSDIGTAWVVGAWTERRYLWGGWWGPIGHPAGAGGLRPLDRGPGRKGHPVASVP